jgi:hypothetical protein
MSDVDKIAESLRERGSGTKSRLVSGDLALNCRIQGESLFQKRGGWKRELAEIMRSLRMALEPGFGSPFSRS